MATKIYVGRLPYSTTEEDLQKLFSEYGNVVSAQVIKDRDTGQSKGFAFVEMESESDTQAAIKALDSKELSGRSIMVNVARPKEERSQGNSYRA